MKSYGLRCRYSLATLFVLAVGAIATCLGAWHEFHLAEQLDRVRFRELAERVHGDIVRRAHTYQYGLQSLRSLYQSSEYVTQDEFDSAAGLWTSVEDFPGVIGIGFVERVPMDAGSIQAGETKASPAGSSRPDTPTSSGAGSPKGARNFDRMVMRRFQPLAGNEPWIGLSLDDLPEARRAAEQSVKSDQATLTEGMEVNLDGRMQKVYLSILPVYQHDGLEDAGPSNEGEVSGWICFVLDVNKEFADIADAVGGELSFRLYEGSGQLEKQIFGDAAVDQANSKVHASQHQRGYCEIVPLHVGGRQWTAAIHTTDQFARAPRDLAWSLIVCGCLVTLLISYILHVQNTALRRAKQLADCMTEELRRLAMVAQRTTNGVLITDADRKIEWTNQGFTRLTGYQTEEVLGLNPGHFLQCPNTDPDTLVGLRNAIRGVTSFHGEVLNRRKDGSEYWVDLEIQPLLDDFGDLYGFIGIQSDITDRVEAERRARSLAGILQESPNEIYLFDTETLRIVEVNAGACRQLGYRRNELIGQPANLFNPFISEEKIRQLVEPLATSSVEKLGFDTKHRRKDGSDYHAHVHLHRSRFDGHDVYVAFVADLTDRLKLEQQLAQAQKLESMGQLAAGVAHEINTPMQCVVTNVEYLSETYVSLFKIIDAHRDSSNHSPTSWQQRKLELEQLEIECDYESLRQNTLEAIVESAEAATRVVEVVRAMKTMAHPGSDEKIWVDLNEMVRSAVMVSKNRWKRFASMEMALDDSLPCIPLLSNQINQVLLNLLVNSADAIYERLGKDNSEELGRIELATWWESDGVMFRIRDTGCGMTEEVKRRAFDPFFTTKEVGRGTGQGLAISYDVVVQKHSGRIEIDSEVGQGTSVTIWLPGHSDDASAAVCELSLQNSVANLLAHGLSV